MSDPDSFGAGGANGGDQAIPIGMIGKNKAAIERTAALWLVQGAEAGTLPAELESVLLRQTGVAGRAPSLLQQFAEESGGVADWRARLEEENRLALEDHLPAARVRAFDWLASRGLAPSG